MSPAIWYKNVLLFTRFWCVPKAYQVGGDSPKKGVCFKTIQKGWFRDLFMGHPRLAFDGFR